MARDMAESTDVMVQQRRCEERASSLSRVPPAIVEEPISGKANATGTAVDVIVATEAAAPSPAETLAMVGG
jgi:hypothetical protein